MSVREDEHVLHAFYRVAAARRDDVYLTQPLGGGRVEDFTFGRMLDESKRMAAYLGSLGLPPGSRIAIVSKNCAHFFLTDLAIWMAGHVSVALFPTYQAATVRFVLEHSDSRLLFVGKLDAWDEIARGVAARDCPAWPCRWRRRRRCRSGTTSSPARSPSTASRAGRPTTGPSSSTPRAAPASPRA